MNFKDPALANALLQKCPRCGKGELFKRGFTLDVCDVCDSCGLALGRNDSADGPAVFLIFFLGFLLVPAALMLEAAFSPPPWVHALIWIPLAFGITLGLMRPIKAAVISLQFKHRASDWQE